MCVKTDSLSGSSCAQNKRLGALNKFKSKSRSVLLATDVASRGLDIPHVDCVINYDIPTHSKVRPFKKIVSLVLFVLTGFILTMCVLTGLHPQSRTNSQSRALREIHHICHSVGYKTYSFYFNN